MDPKALHKAVDRLRRADRVMVLSGAGMSTAAGIPDFRSPGGLYGTSATLLDRFTYVEREGRGGAAWQRAQLQDDIRNALTHSFFRWNPLPYHEMRRGMIIGLGENQWKLTIGHVLAEILNRQGKLRLLASQNIDGLDHKVVSDKTKLYNPHGLMSTLVSEPSDVPLCTSAADPIYQRYVELVKANVKDIYADRPPRQGKSSHLWPGPRRSAPISLAMLGELLPPHLHEARQHEDASGTFSLKPGTVLFDRTLWRTDASGAPCDAFQIVRECDCVLVMGTSLSGLTIDHVAHTAGRELGLPLLVFDVSTAPVDSPSAATAAGGRSATATCRGRSTRASLRSSTPRGGSTSCSTFCPSCAWRRSARCSSSSRRGSTRRQRECLRASLKPPSRTKWSGSGASMGTSEVPGPRHHRSNIDSHAASI